MKSFVDYLFEARFSLNDIQNLSIRWTKKDSSYWEGQFDIIDQKKVTYFVRIAIKYNYRPLSMLFDDKSPSAKKVGVVDFYSSKGYDQAETSLSMKSVNLVLKYVAKAALDFLEEENPEVLVFVSDTIAERNAKQGIYRSLSRSFIELSKLDSLIVKDIPGGAEVWNTDYLET